MQDPTMVEANIVKKMVKPVRMPWSSGRLLTDAERDRKRRVNRESQLLRRQRIKERLQAFESRLGKVEEHYDQLCRSQPTAQPPSQPSSQNSSEFAEEPTLGGTFASAQDAPLAFSALRSIRIIQTPSTASLPSLVSKANQNTTLRDYLEEALESVYSVDPRQVCTNDIHNQDALIRGVVLGWNDLQKESFNCPLWRILSWADELLTARTAIATRLALLRGAHLMLMNLISPDRVPSLPRWFRPGKFQLYISHHVTCDYFPW
ncbi:uncharacterized protein BJX67DRAFT_296599 [Aspergillus lucknowensis]|uniref:BZIP domain-containing protein n=1 Tax=Aspergillus lucknowensis TaxID=176173 RepID=A0ABR4LD31_9EURO